MKAKAKTFVTWIKISQIRTKTVAVCMAVAAAIILPQLVHVAGTAVGAGSGIGEMLLPMHLPVLFIGFLMGPAAGAAAGVLSPAVSYLLTGMPTSMMLPYITIELAVYGLAAGLMQRSKWNNVVKLVVAQIAGRAARSLAVACSVYLLGSQTLVIGMAWKYITVGIWGIMIQLLVLPVLLYFVQQKRMRRGI